MDFTPWSPSHTVLVLFIAAGAIGQIAVYFYKTAQNDKKIDKQSEDIKQLGETFFHALERLEDRMDKRLSDMQAETNHRFAEINQRLSDMQTETNQRLSDIEASIRQFNQNHIDHLTHHNAPPTRDGKT